MYIAEGAYKPHQVAYKGSGKYYARTDVGKYQLDHTEISKMMNETFQVNKKVDDFIARRVEAIDQEQFPLQLLPGAKISILLVPQRSFLYPETIDIFRLPIIARACAL